VTGFLPEKIEHFEDVLAVRWNNGQESYLDAHILRNESPSAEQKGEKDIFGIKTKTTPKIFQKGEVSIKKFEEIGNYAIRISFSDGHNTGIYSWQTLKSIEQG
tara:strand:- start:172 stop:480 length:309 start_codon:yes stop_codon:yes gene_type:complete